VVNLAYKARKSYWDHSAPTVWPPPASYADMRRIAAQELPGVRYRRHLLWRYSPRLDQSDARGVAVSDPLARRRPQARVTAVRAGAAACCSA